VNPIDSLKHVLFESPLKLGLVLFFVLLGCLSVWRRRRTARSREVFLLAAAASLGLLTVQGLVKTDRERIRHVIDDLARAVDQQDAAVVLGYIDPQYDLQGHTREELEALVRDRLRRIDVDQPLLHNVQIRTVGDRGDARLTALARVVLDQTPVGYVVSVWDLQFRRRPNGWKVSLVDPVAIQGQPAGSLWDVARF
jgi:hypothetical protein